VQSQFAGGLRVTDKVRCKSSNGAGRVDHKQIVGYINAPGQGHRLCGKDGNMVIAKKATRRVVDPDSNIENRRSRLSASQEVDLSGSTCARRELIPVLARSAPRRRRSFNVNATPSRRHRRRAQGKRFLLLTDVPGVLDKSKE